MSWSISFIGTADKLVEALDNQSNILTGASKEEFDAVKPHIIGIVNQNYNKKEGSTQPTLRVVANGHGYKGPDQEYVNANVEVKTFFETIL
jgi:hypothetical protein